MSGLQTVTLALDWVPNTNHVGFYVAKYKGYYRDVGLDVRFISAHEDGFQTLPAERIYRKEVHFGIAPSETVISYNVRCGSYKKSIMKAIAAVFQEDSSAIVTLKDSGIERPRQLDGMRYATYGATYEGSLVRQLIRSDGGQGRFEELSLPLLGLWNTVMKGLADATWVFMGWEGVEARRRGIELNVFRLAEYGVPYGWPELLITHADTLWEHPGMVKAFLEASTKGHQYAAAHPEHAADMLVDLAREECPDMPDPLVRDMVRESMMIVKEHLLDEEGRWGAMDCQRWETFLDFLARNELLTTNIPPRRDQAMPSYGQLDSLLQEGNAGGNVLREDVRASSLFTNAFLPPQQEFTERYRAQRGKRAVQQHSGSGGGGIGGAGSGSGEDSGGGGGEGSARAHLQEPQVEEQQRLAEEEEGEGVVGERQEGKQQKRQEAAGAGAEGNDSLIGTAELLEHIWQQQAPPLLQVLEEEVEEDDSVLVGVHEEGSSVPAPECPPPLESRLWQWTSAEAFAGEHLLAPLQSAETFAGEHLLRSLP